MNNYLEECSRKILAAKYFLNRLKKFYEPGKLRKGKIPNEVFYYTDASIFELHSAAQMILQQINVASEVNYSAEKVSWSSSSFRQQLQEKSPDLFIFWNGIDNDGHYHVLEAARHHISHRGTGFLQAEIGPEGVVSLMSILIRWRKRDGKYFQIPTGGSVELLDELQSIITLLETKLKELKEST